MGIKSMNLNNIKRNQLDYLLTDILPNELSDRFTYSHFYEYLIERSDEVEQMYKQLEETKAKVEGMFQGKKCWASMPLKYSIMKELHTVREISLVQPLAALEITSIPGFKASGRFKQKLEAGKKSVEETA